MTEEAGSVEIIDSTPDTGVKFEELEAMLSGNAAPAEQQAQAASPAESEDSRQTEAADEQAEQAETFTVKQLAERLQAEPAELYKALQIDLGNGESLSLGEIKDRAKDLVKSEAILAEANDQRLQIENDLLVKNQALQRQAQAAGIQLTPELVEQMQAERKQYNELQDRIAVELMPEWSDTEARHEDQKRISKALDEYGFYEAEKALVKDARLLKVFRDIQRLREDIRAVKPVRPKQKPPQSQAGAGNAAKRVRDELAAGNVSQDQAIATLGKYL